MNISHQFNNDDYLLAAKCLGNCGPRLQRLPTETQGYVKTIELKKKQRWHAMAVQKERYQMAVDAVRYLSVEFERLQALIHRVKNDCAGVGFTSMESIESIAYAQENLTRTVNEIDRYREIPTIVENLSNALNQNPVEYIPRANYEHRTMVSWSYNSQEEWKAARSKYGKGKTKKYNNMARLVEEYANEANNVIGGLTGPVNQLRSKLWEVRGGGAGAGRKGGRGVATTQAHHSQMVYVAIDQCFDLSRTKPNYLVLVADIIETSQRQHQMVETLLGKLDDLADFEQELELGEGSYFDPDVARAEILKTKQGLGIRERERKKCRARLALAASKQYNLLFVQGIVQHYKDLDGGITADAVARLSSTGTLYDFDEVMAGLKHVAASILQQTESVAVCFPPWYNLRELFVQTYAVESVASIRRHIYRDHTGAEEDTPPHTKDGKDGKDGKDVDRTSGGTTSTDANVPTSSSNLPLSTLSNDRLVVIVEWLRLSANGFEQYSERHKQATGKQSKLDAFYFSNLKKGINDGSGACK